MVMQSEPLTPQSKVDISPWRPLLEPLFRALWIATIVSNIGTWIQDIGSSWLMTSLAPTPWMVSLVQAASTLPMSLLALPAGALADVADRRKVLIVTQIWMLLASGILGILTLLGKISSEVLLALTFALGIGAALNGPAWQAITSELVSKEDLPQAVSLQSASINIARAVGPAIGGLLVAWSGPQAAFLLNSVSFLGVIAVLFLWHRKPPESALPAERFIGALKAGWRFTQYSLVMQTVFIRTAAFLFFASATWALTPLIVRSELHQDAFSLGILLGFLGLGAVAGTALLPRFKLRWSSDRMVALATLLYTAFIVILALIRRFELLCPAMFIGGLTWVTILTAFNVTVQKASPGWIKARALSFYLLVIYGSLGLGSMTWGWIAGIFGIPKALFVAAIGMVVGLTTENWFRLSSGDHIETTPSMHWPMPYLAERTPPHHVGPVQVTITYDIRPEQKEDFLKAMKRLSRSRMRNGAIRWEIYEDITVPSRFIEQFILETWLDHLRQHERVSLTDQEIQRAAEHYHIGPEPPRVSHWIYGYAKTKD